jgi:hypothetical protein
MRGSNASLIIRQGKTENFKPTLFIEARNGDAGFEQKLQTALANVSKDFPGISLVKQANGWMIAVPEKYNDGHEAHFAQVTKKYLGFLQNNNMPAWEVPNMIAKYYTTTSAKEMADKKQ